jgi:hypothetical protein
MEEKEKQLAKVLGYVSIVLGIVAVAILGYGIFSLLLDKPSSNVCIVQYQTVSMNCSLNRIYKIVNAIDPADELKYKQDYNCTHYKFDNLFNFAKCDANITFSNYSLFKIQVVPYKK